MKPSVLFLALGVAFAGGVLPQLQPAPPHRAGKQQQTEIERCVTQLQSFQGMRFTDEMAGQGPDTPHGWSATTVQETRPEPGGVRRPTTTGAAVTRGGSARTGARSRGVCGLPR